MSIVSHSKIELSFNKYVQENLVDTYGYSVSFGELRFDSDIHDLWMTLEFEEIGAGAKKFSPVKVDVVSRITGRTYRNDETTAIDRIRDKFTNAIIPLYDFTIEPPVLISDEKLIIKNDDGRFTVDRIVLNNLKVDDLKNNLRRSSVFLRLMLLTDTVGGRVI